MSSDNMHDDAEFERFLAGEDDLSRRLHALEQAEPPAELDDAIMARIAGALAAEKTEVVQAQAAANDPVGPTPAVPPTVKPRRFAGFWYLPLGLAAGVLLTVGYRGYQHRQDDEVAMDSPKVVAQADVPRSLALEEPPPPPMKAVAPQSDAPQAPVADARAPEPAVEPVPAVTAAAPRVAASVPMSPPVASSRAAAKRAPERQVTIVGSSVRRQDAETPSPAQVITAEQLKSSGYSEAKSRRQDDKKTDTGTAMAWSYDPAQVQAERRNDGQLLGRQEYQQRKALPVMDGPPPAPVSSPAPAPAAPAAPSMADARPMQPPPMPRPTSAAPPPPAPAAAAPAAAAPVAASENSASQVAIVGKIAHHHNLEEAHADPVKWLALIDQQIKDGDDQDALAEWDKFLLAHPAYPVKDELTAKIKALRQDQTLEPAKPVPASSAKPGN